MSLYIGTGLMKPRSPEWVVLSQTDATL